MFLGWLGGLLLLVRPSFQLFAHRSQRWRNNFPSLFLSLLAAVGLAAARTSSYPPAAPLPPPPPPLRSLLRLMTTNGLLFCRLAKTARSSAASPFGSTILRFHSHCKVALLSLRFAHFFSLPLSILYSRGESLLDDTNFYIRLGNDRRQTD